MSNIYHKHHIIPRHMGGTDDPSNLIELTIQEHAEAHRKLFEEHGRWQDEIAWKTLSGQISNADAIKLAQTLANTGKHVSQKTREKLRQFNKGKKLSEEHRRKISLNCRGKRTNKRKKESKPRNKDSYRQELVICPNCNKIGGKNLMKRHHFNNCKIHITP